MNNTNNIHNMKSIILALLVATLSFNGHAQTDVEIKKLEGLIERLGAVKTYSEKPAYYLQIDKTECRLLVRVNDIPLGYHFIENEDESVLRPINSLLFGSGKHTIRIEVYPDRVKRSSPKMPVSISEWFTVRNSRPALRKLLQNLILLRI